MDTCRASMNRKTNKPCNTHTKEYSSPVKRNASYNHVEMNLKTISTQKYYMT